MTNSDISKVSAFYVDEKVICADCMTETDWNQLTQDSVMTQKEADENDKIFFCDRCGEPI